VKDREERGRGRRAHYCGLSQNVKPCHPIFYTKYNLLPKHYLHSIRALSPKE
jgi:hypothetical protein